ncbi:hypothetical protein D3C71_1755040 [compost metagenome]
MAVLATSDAPTAPTALAVCQRSTTGRLRIINAAPIGRAKSWQAAGSGATDASAVSPMSSVCPLTSSRAMALGV